METQEIKRKKIIKCPECGAKLKRAKMSRYGLTKSCAGLHSCGFVLIYENKWFSHGIND